MSYFVAGNGNEIHITSFIFQLLLTCQYIRGALRTGTHCRQSTFSPICCRFVAIDIVAKVEHVQLGRLSQKWVTFVDRM